MMRHHIFVLLIFLSVQDFGFLWRRRRRRNPPPPPPPRNCQVGPWTSPWPPCSHACGNAGTQTRTRTKTVTECCGGTCRYHLSETRACNRNACQNGGTPAHGRCTCTVAWTGTCCEHDVNECLRKPCQHNCHNVPGSFTCSCFPCYTKSGTTCHLAQCSIAGKCYPYGSVNPVNQCQNCQKTRETVWSNNNALQCSDNNLCTRNDHCVEGVCKGTAFSCRSCETCDGSGCKIKPGYCVLDNQCYSNGDIRPGKPCQQCDSNNPTRWTSNNNLKCSDHNIQTKNDRCNNGECRGTPYTCLTCEEHFNDACRLKADYCIIKYNNIATCYNKQATKPGNPCQWCNPSEITSTWSNKNGVSCDDGEKCTRKDTCQNGQCKGISFTCNTLCQYCDGQSCILHTGYGYTNGKCTCKIAGKEYVHHELKSDNECQWCDLHDKTSKKSSVWSNRPAVVCNDGKTCTKQDLCQNGRCIGTAYKCRDTYPQSSCIRTSQCVGDGTCKDIMKDSGIICHAATDQCDQPERCDGVLGSCPSKTIDPIQLKEGQASITLPTFSSKISFQSSITSIHLKVTGFTVSCGALKIKWSLLSDSSSCAVNDVNARLLSEQNNHVLSGLSLQDNKAYKIAVLATDMRGNSGIPVCSNSVVIDVSKPSGGWIRDGPGSDDLNYQASKTISVTWGGFNTVHGIAKYEISLIYTSLSNSDKEVLLQDFINVNLKVSYAKTFSSLTDGSRVVAKVRAFTKAGLSTEKVSDGVIIDTSPPSKGSVFDGDSNLDLKYVNWSATYEASWANFNDIHSRIVDYKMGVEKEGGGLITSGLTSVGMKYTNIISNLKLVSGVKYCALIEAVNAAGLSVQASSNCVLIDHDNPVPGMVRDGAGTTDINYQSADDIFHANWNNFNDGSKGSGINEYHYMIVDENDNEITPWQSNNLQENVTVSNIRLQDRHKYFIVVRAFDKVGHFTDVKSDGVLIDTSHPVFDGEIKIDGEKQIKNDLVYIDSKTSLTATWPQFIDQHSGMKKYQWIILEKNQAIDPRFWKDVPGSKLATKATFNSLSLKEEYVYTLIIRGMNNAGLTSQLTSSPFIALSTPPNLGSVFDGLDPRIDIDYQTNASEIHATWSGFGQKNLKSYYFAVGSCIDGNYHVTNNDFVPVIPALSTSYSLYNLKLVNGQRYCVKIKAENLAGVQSSDASSDGVIIDATAPVIKRAMVRDGSGDDDIDFQSGANELSATWTGIVDSESKIQHYEFAISRNRASVPDITSFEDIGLVTSYTVVNLTLTNEVYYVIICGINNAGLKSCAMSDGVLIDTSIPTYGVVNDGIIEPDLHYQSSTTQLYANWEGVWDLESRINHFEWGVGLSEGTVPNVQDFVDVGLETHVATKTTLSLKHGFNYTVFLKVFNRAGGVRQLRSNGIRIDTTAPIPSVIIPGEKNWDYVPKTSTYYSSGELQLNVEWEKFEENESEIWFYKWSIGTCKYGTQIQPLVNIGLLTKANTSNTDVILRPGIPYFITVTAQNRANLVSRVTSPPMIFDDSDPMRGKMQVTDHEGIEKSSFKKSESIFVKWEGFKDFESGVKEYIVLLKSDSGSAVNYVIAEDVNSFLIPTNSVQPRQKYHITLQCINNAGLSASVHHPPFIVDASPPVFTGNSNVLPRKSFRSNLTGMKILWEHFEDQETEVISYMVGVGSQVLKDDILTFQDNGLANEFTFKEKFANRDKYYVTVRANNTAGLSTLLLTDVIIFDDTPPKGNNDSVIDGLSSVDITFMSLNQPISANWKNIEDKESGIKTIEYCVGTTPQNCLTKSFTSSNHNKQLIVCLDCELCAGTTYFVQLRVTNEAGLSTIFTTNGVTVDSTPPRIGYAVFDGDRGETPDVEKVESSWIPMVTWYGVKDSQSGIRSCQWQIAQRNKDGTEIVVSRQNLVETTFGIAHTQQAIDKLLQLSPNISYINIIECWNNAGVSTQLRSNGWTVVDEWPKTAVVWDGVGSEDIIYDVIGESVGATWRVFQGDYQDPVVHYEWSIGTSPYLDDVMSFTEVGLVTRASQLISQDTHINIEAGVKYYATVRATTLSGNTSERSSDGFILDKTPPRKGKVQVDHVVTDQEKKMVDLKITWRGFEDDETGIKSYDYCLGLLQDICHTDKEMTDMLGEVSVSDFIPSEVPYYAIVIATNEAGLRTMVSSEPFKIDITPPVKGIVRNGIDHHWQYMNSSVPLVTTWFGFVDEESGIEKCSLSVIEEQMATKQSFGKILELDVATNGSIVHHNLTIISALRYVSIVECQNNDGFQTKVTSDGVIVDDTAPVNDVIFDGDSTDDMEYQSCTDTLTAHWSHSRDLESGMKEYFIAVGSGSNSDDVRAFFSVALSKEVTIKNLVLQPGSTYFITLESVNNAGLMSRISSNGVTIDNTPPIITQLKLENFSKTTQPFIGGDYMISTSWQETRDDESSIKSLQYCVGVTYGGCQVQEMTDIPIDSKNVTCTQCKLKHKFNYFVSIRVWNNADLYTVATSQGIQADLTSPRNKQVKKKEVSHISCVDQCNLTVMVNDFEDHESGIDYCEYRVKHSNGQIITPIRKTTNIEEQVQVDGTRLNHGNVYHVVTSCLNFVGLRSAEVVSKVFKVDNTPAVKGKVIVSHNFNQDLKRKHSGCHFLNTTFRVHWFDFKDDESDISTFRVAIGRGIAETDVISYGKKSLKNEDTFDLKQHGLSPGEIVYVTLEVTNGAGLSTVVSSSPTRLLADKDASGEHYFQCLNF